MQHLILFIFGSIFGSFMHVIFSRDDWYKGRSRCDSCGYTLKWYDLIPIVSYICIGGKCRKCKEKIRPTHILSEILWGAAVVAAFLCFRENIWIGIIYSSGIVFMAAASVQDMIEKQVYALVLYAGIIITAVLKIIYLATYFGFLKAFEFVLYAIVIKVILYAISVLSRDKVGAGDFDIIMLIYIICGGIGCLYSIFFASFFGCGIYIPKVIMKQHDKSVPIPFVPLLLVGTIIYVICGVIV